MPKKRGMQSDRLNQLLVGLEEEAPRWLGEALAGSRISLAQHDDWREIISESIHAVRYAVERGDAAAAALAMHYAQKYASAALDLRREVDQRKATASTAGKAKREPKSKAKRLEARKLLKQMKPGASQRARARGLMRKIKFKNLEAARNEVRSFDKDSG